MSEVFNLQLIPGSVPTVIHVSQFDTERTWIFRPLFGSEEYQKPSGAIAAIEATKPDKTIVIHDCTYNADGTITLNLSEMPQLVTVAGDVRGKIRIINTSDTTLASASIIIAVDLAGIETEAKVSKSDIELIAETMKHGGSAADSAQAAENSANRAAECAEQTEQDSTNAKKYADNSASSAKLSESWAVGGTNSRSGENTNNSKYFSGQSADSAKSSESYAHGGTGTRSGEDNDNAKKYSQNSADSAKNSKSWAVGGTNSRNGENTDNSKYYSEQSEDSATLAQSWAVGGTGTRAEEDTHSAKYYADVAKTFSTFNAPQFHLDLDTMHLIQEEPGDHLGFSLDENKHLLYELVF